MRGKRGRKPWQSRYYKHQKKQRRKRLFRQLHVEVDWPPEEYVVKKWNVKGFTCYILRGFASLCGYVALPQGHPCHGLHYGKIPVSVHGGLTFSQLIRGGSFVVGFDTAHAWDWLSFPETNDEGKVVPDEIRHILERPGRIWTVEDMVKETGQLAVQLAEIAEVEDIFNAKGGGA